MNLSTVVNLAQTLLPANSPLRQIIPQAAEMAKQFSPNRDGVAKLMAAYGKRKSDLQEAVKMLDNPILQNTLGRIPGLNSALRNAASNLANDPQFTSGTLNNQFDQPINNNPSIPNANSFSSSSFSERLKRLP